MRADRLLSTLLLLQAHGRLSAKALAGRLEVSERMDIAVECVLSLGGQVEILEPTDLGDRVVAAAEAALARLGRPKAGESARHGSDDAGHEPGRPARSRR